MDKDRDLLQKLQCAIQSAGDLPYVWNLRTDEIEWLGDFHQFTGDIKGDIPRTGSDLNFLLNAQDLVERLKCISFLKQSSDSADINGIDLEYRIRQTDGGCALIHETARVVASQENGDMQLYGVLRKLAMQHQPRKMMEQNLKRDLLTGYLKRDSFCAAMDDYMFQQAVDEGAVLVVGLDRLGLYNEAFGADNTNDIIIALGRRLEKLTFDHFTIISRIGGDRFAIYVPGLTPNQTSSLATDILSSLSSTPLVASHGSVRVSVSVGSARANKKEYTSLDCVTRAETALQLAKEQGRGCYVPYSVSSEQQKQYRQWLQTGDDVIVAMNGNRLVLAYQPIVDAASHKPKLYECLVRMIKPDGTLMAAGEFIPAVEHLGLSRVLDLYTLRQAVNELILYDNISLCVNISAHTITDPKWMRSLVSLLNENPAMADRLVIEVTETVAMKNLDVACNFVQTLQALGVRIALDDFGAGHTSFSQIQRLGVDFVKIDKSFVRGLKTFAENKAFVKALRQLADSCSIKTIAEGAENEEDVDLLMQEGVHMIQGHAFGKPTLTPPWKETALGPKDIAQTNAV